VIRVNLENILFDDKILIPDFEAAITIIADGHSGNAKKGEDVVCAGVSAIVQTCILAVTKIARIRQKILQHEGYIKSSINVSNADKTNISNLKAILGTMVIGLLEIKKNYPDSIEIIFK
jgi:uncharacterized protein